MANVGWWMRKLRLSRRQSLDIGVNRVIIEWHETSFFIWRSQVSPHLNILAKKQAAKSCHKYRHGAIIIKGGRVLAKGFNRDKTSPTWGSGYKGKIHAESDAIRRAVTQGVRIRGATMIVVRLDDGPSKPCYKCMELIEKFGLEVIHS